MNRLRRALACAMLCCLPCAALAAAESRPPPIPDLTPGTADVVPGAAAAGQANQGVFPYYYNAGEPSADDLVRFDDPPVAGAEPTPPLHDGLGANQGALPGVYDAARLTQTRETLESEIRRARAALALIRSYSDEDDVKEALDIYAGMPAFGDNTVINELRADAANFLILELARQDRLAVAQDVYRALPYDIPGDDAMLAKARAIINLTTYLVRDEQYNDAYAVLMDIGRIRNRDALNRELFQLMTRMIPYLDNADETDKAHRVYTLLLEQVRSQEAASLFAENIPSLSRYFLAYAARTESPERRTARLDFMNRIFESLGALSENRDVALARNALAAELVDFYTEAGDRERARQYYDILNQTDATRLLEK